MDTSKRYLLSISLLFAITFIPILVINFLLISNTLGKNQLIWDASEWQKRSHGVTIAGGEAPPDGHLLFKTLRFHDRLPEINTVVLGSSTVMGITQKAFPDEYRIYNFATNSNPLYSVIGNAEYIQDHFHNIKWLVIPLDWSVGFLYLKELPTISDLSLSTALKNIKFQGTKIPVIERIRDAISYPKIFNLFEIVKSAIIQPKHFISSAAKSLSIGGDEYKCPDGSLAKDYNLMYRGICSGFRYDGSATFANLATLGEIASNQILRTFSKGTPYYRYLVSTNGKANPLYLERLSEIAKRANKNGGGVIFIRPPMLCGVEAEILRHPKIGGALAETKREIEKWAFKNNLILIDAGQSEEFGCTANEFIDSHHALDTCYQKVFDQFFSIQ